MLGLIEKIITSFVILGLLSIKKIERDLPNSSLAYDILIFYKSHFPFTTQKSFYFENKLSFAPPLLICCREWVDVRKIKVVSGVSLTEIVREEMEKSYIFISTHLRMEKFTSSNFYGNFPFTFKKKNGIINSLNLPIYPDIKFIRHLKDEIYPDLTVEIANERVKVAKKDLDDSFNQTH
jgi:hypothetical protein